MSNKTKELRAALENVIDVINEGDRLIDEQTDGPFEMRIAHKYAKRAVDDVFMEVEVVDATIEDLLVSLKRVSDQRDHAYRQRNIAVRYIKDHTDWEKVIYVLRQAGHKQLAAQVESVFK